MQMDVLGDDLQFFLVFDDAISRYREITIEDRLGRSILELSIRRVFESDHPTRQDRETVDISLDDSVWSCLWFHVARVEMGFINCSHTNSGLPPLSLPSRLSSVQPITHLVYKSSCSHFKEE